MSWLDNIIGFISPYQGIKRAAFKQELDYIKKHGYDAGGFDRLNKQWHPLIESAEMTDRTDRDIVRARARDIERNSDMGNAVIKAFTRNIIGSGYTLQAKTDNEELNTKIETLWNEWTKAKNCDVTGTQSFSQILRMAVKRKKVDGGILFKKCYTNQGIVPFQLQALEVDELSISWSSPKDKSHKVAGGIEYNSYNRPVGYWISQYSIDGLEIATPKYYQAKDIIYIYTKSRPSQVREISDLTPTLTRIRDSNEFITAVSVKERIAACLAVFIKKALPVSTGLGRQIVNNARQEVTYEGKSLAPGMIKEMNAGDEIQVVDPKSSGDDASTFLKLQQRLIASGQGLSYESTTRDMSETNYSSARQSAIEDELTYAEDIELFQSFMSEVYEEFLKSAVLAGIITIPDFFSKKTEYSKHMWIAGQKRWIDPVKEANANRIALENGMKTFQQIAAENGKDWKEQIDDMAAAKEYAEKAGVSIVGGGINAG